MSKDWRRKTHGEAHSLMRELNSTLHISTSEFEYIGNKYGVKVLVDPSFVFIIFPRLYSKETVDRLLEKHAPTLAQVKYDVKKSFETNRPLPRTYDVYRIVNDGSMEAIAVATEHLGNPVVHDAVDFIADLIFDYEPALKFAKQRRIPRENLISESYKSRIS